MKSSLRSQTEGSQGSPEKQNQQRERESVCVSLPLSLSSVPLSGDTEIYFKERAHMTVEVW